ncbi:hypothetical protein [Microbacterium sp. PRC9]|nr:hypothetical protein [Microbacterium sp. PRC9]MDT0143152.1 hypothetical protein [Microbacterium sp. PRC9]
MIVLTTPGGCYEFDAVLFDIDDALTDSDATIDAARCPVAERFGCTR